MVTEKKGPMREEDTKECSVPSSQSNVDNEKERKEKSGKSWQILEKSGRIKSENPSGGSFLPL